MGVRAMVFSFSVIVDNFNIRRAGLILPPLERPLETDAPLVVDPNGMLPLAVGPQGFQTVGVERGKVARRSSGIENAQTLLSLPPKRLPLADLLASRETLRVPVAVTPDHLVFYIIIDE